MELLIDKKYLVRLECYTRFGYGGLVQPYAVRYVFRLPERAGVPKGYTVCIDADVRTNNVIWKDDDPYTKCPIGTKELEHDKTYRLDRPGEAVYEATMTENREEGKRYKRYKYTAEDLYALYQNVDLKAAELAVAKIDIYIEGQEGNRHKVLYGNRIDKTVYLVGKVQGCWFYCSELDTKRLIGSHGVTILGRIEEKNKPAAQKLIDKYNKDLRALACEFNNIYSTLDNVEKAAWSFKFYDEIHTPKSEKVNSVVHNIQKSIEAAKQAISEELATEDAAKSKLASDLEKQLKKLYIKGSITA